MIFAERFGGDIVAPYARRTARLARDDTAGHSFLDLGPWLLPLAMLAILPLFRRRR